MTTPSTRRLLLAVLMTIAMTATATMPVLATPADQPGAAQAAAGWIADELDKTQPGFDVFGRAAARTDVLLALAATGGEEGSSRQALAELRTGAADLIGPAGAGNPGSLAKVLLVLFVNREDPAGFLDGRDLEAELRAGARPDGSYADDVFNHSLAMIALGASEGGVPQSAVDWLTGVQRPDGSFASAFAPDVADVDTTALALQALVAAGTSTAVTSAAAYLVGSQSSDGSWPSPFGDPNTNTAGVAGQALRAAGETGAADRAADFVIALQTAGGGIRFTAAETEANAFATLQGVLALGAPALHLLDTNPYADVAWESLFAFEADWLGDTGITEGCDPPANDSFCPAEQVTRGQMAAFLQRALGDTLPTGQPVEFTDDDGSIFETDIQWLAAAGITTGCNPPANDRFCPGDDITRGQMAAFVHRALGDTLPTGRPVEFTDDDGSIFETDIQWLAAAGITTGCNPPANDRFCPADGVTRGQMAAFLFRALAG